MASLARFWPVFRTSVNNTFSLSAARYRYLTKKERLWEPVVIFLSIGVMVVMFEYAFYQMALGMAQAGAMLGQPGAVFTFALLLSSILVLLFGLFMVVSVFYFSNDLPLLVPLPLSPGTIIMGKFGTVLLGQYIGVVAVMAPTALAYANLLGGGLLFWLAVVAVVLLTPVLPLTLASALALIFMRFINRSHRDILLVIISLVIVGVVLAGQFSMMNVPEDQMADHLQQIMAGRVELVDRIGRGFPPVVWATKAITGAGTALGTLFLVGLAGLSLVGIWTTYVVGERFYYKGLIGGQEIARRRLSVEQAATARAGAMTRVRRESALRALYQREWRLFMRHPLYVMNGFMASVIIPALLLFGLAIPGEQLEMITSQIPLGGDVSFFAAIGAAGIIAFLASLNTTAATSVSREGKSLWISKVIPVSPERMVQGKMLFSAVSALISAAPIIIAFWLFWRPPAVLLAASAVIGLLASAVLLLVGLLIDMSRPYLTWTNPQQAVKTNLNVVLMMPAAAVLFVAMGFLISWLFGRLGLGGLPTLAIVTAVLALLVLPAYRITVSAAGRLYERMDC
jgi:ABC-2 type transport system permease protein